MCILGRVWLNIFISGYANMGASSITKRFRSEDSDEGWYVISTSRPIIIPKGNDSGIFQKSMIKIKI